MCTEKRIKMESAGWPAGRRVAAGVPGGGDRLAGGPGFLPLSAPVRSRPRLCKSLMTGFSSYSVIELERTLVP